MGYESKIIVVNPIHFPATGDMKEYDCGITIAEFDLCKLGYSDLARKFYHTFSKNAAYKIFVDGEEVSEDRYGDSLKYASASEVLEVMEEMEQSDKFSGCKHRIHPAVMLLRGFKEVENLYDDLQVVFFGY